MLTEGCHGPWHQRWPPWIRPEEPLSDHALVCSAHLLGSQGFRTEMQAQPKTQLSWPWLLALVV